MRTQLIQEVRRTIQEYRMIDSGDGVVVAVSGGHDSVALLHVLHALKPDLGCELHVAHLNHELRGTESREDADFVADLAGSLALPFTVHCAGRQLRDRPKGVSLEEAARKIRYDFLGEVARNVGARRIATGHTMDDQAETVLMRMIQGTGPGGLAGIRPVREGRVIRPLIRCRSGEIASYLVKAGLTPRDDSSNQDTTLLRNRVRHRLLPLLKGEFNPGIVPALARIAAVEQEVNSSLRAAAESALREISSGSPGKIRLAIDGFRGYDVALQLYILRAAIEGVLGRLTDVSYEHIQALLRLARRGETPFKRIMLPGSLVAYREHDDLVVAREGTRENPLARVIAIPGTTLLPAFDLEIRASLHPFSDLDSSTAARGDEAHFDWETLHPPLQVRGWKPGDRFRPSGMRGTKKIQDFFVDTKIPRSVRNRIPLLIDGEELHWVIGYRTSESSRVTDQTREILRLQIISLDG
ncbi:MAG: tRNA lysidine(34) synthetase TilS [Candidatus Eisenbacteria sp.]|nr:tRNA lysidine(34) synthetase TilS [Candidatus Eisenbacteria bacterium]